MLLRALKWGRTAAEGARCSNADWAPDSFGVHRSLKTVWSLSVAVVASVAKLLHASATFVSTQHVQGNLMP